MTAALMAYGTVAAALAGIGVFLIEDLLRVRGIAVRYLWAGALALTLGLVATAPLQMDIRRDGVVATGQPNPALQGETTRRADPSSSFLHRLREGGDRLIQRPIELGLRAGGEVDAALPIVWAILSAVLLILGGATLLRNRRARSRWPLTEVDGTRVRIAPAMGPAVLGVLRPEIVIPRWLLSSSAEERRLAILHEGEHVRAGDHRLLAGACFITALLPWNPAVWWILLRLRLAVEVDCDDRVLRSGIERRKYGTMLIEITGRVSTPSLGVPALAGFPSTLERRLLAMSMTRSRRTVAHRAGVALFGVVALLAACEAHLPTVADINALDAERAESAARELGLIEAADSTIYIVNGVEVSAEVAREINPVEIVTVEVRREEGEVSRGQVMISTRGGAAEGGEVEVRGFGVGPDSDRTVPGAEDVEIRLTPALSGLDAAGDGGPLFIIDGEYTDGRALDRIPPTRIRSISVLKSSSATDQYEDPRARNGVVIVTTGEEP